MKIATDSPNLVDNPSVAVVCSAPIEATWFSSEIQKCDYRIAVDGGANHLYEVGVIPDAAIGDMDSVATRTMRWMESENVPLMLHNPDKDHTDLELALIYLSEQVESPAVTTIFGATGAYLHHELGNMFTLCDGRFGTLRLEMCDVGQIVRQVRPNIPMQFDASDGATVSFIPLDNSVRVVQSGGLKWALEHDTLKFGGAPTGTCNKIVGDEAHISISSGLLLAIQSRP